MKRPIVFSLVHDQSVFMTIIMSLLTFLSVLALGVALSIGTGVSRWNSQWTQFATVQVSDAKKIDVVTKILQTNQDKFKSIKKITPNEMQELMSPWISGGNVLKNYLPTMWEIEFKDKADMPTLNTALSNNARFLTHANALKTSTSAGWKMILMASLILILTLGTIGICISYIARNTATLHRRELEILNQIGASDNYVAKQMQIIVGKICLSASAFGLISALPILLLIISTAHSARIGLMAMIGLNTTGWLLIITLPILITLFAIHITKKTTFKILSN